MMRDQGVARVGGGVEMMGDHRAERGPELRELEVARPAHRGSLSGPIRRHPVLTLAVAATTGFALGRLLR